MKSISPDDVLKSKSRAAANHSAQTSKTPVMAPGSRPATVLQNKMQAAADTSSGVMQLHALQAMADKHHMPSSSQAVVQRIGGKDLITNTYSEVGVERNGKKYVTNVDGFDTTEKKLVRRKLNDAGTTDETGYKVLFLDKDEEQEDWEIMNSVLTWDGNTLCTTDSFNLPVSCIETSEHVIYSHQIDKNKINDHDYAVETKNVGLYLGEVKKGQKKGDKKREIDTIENTLVGNLDDELGVIDPTLTDFDFDAEPVIVGEGLFAHRINNSKRFHAVVVVGKNKKTRQLIVLERDAGSTSGDNIHLDTSWLVNVYSNESKFKESLETKTVKYRIGKLKALED